MTDRALVTGATGMLGAYVAECLQERGWSVRALVRSRARAAWLEEAGVELVEGSLEDGASVAGAVEGCRVVFNSAAAVGAGGGWEHFRRANVEGTGNVVAACAQAGARLVHVSSTAVYGAERYRDVPTDERVDLPELPEEDVYGRSKQESEALVLDAAREGRIWAAAVRPPVMYGIRDRQFVPRIGPVLARGFFPRIAGGRSTLAIVHARHVAEGAILAAESERARGRVYLLTNDFPVTVTDLVRCAEAGLGQRIFAPSVGLGVARAGFKALAGALTLVGRGHVARHADGTLAMLTRDNPFTSDRARSELGWAPSIPPEEGLTEAFRHWRSGGSGSGT